MARQRRALAADAPQPTKTDLMKALDQMMGYQSAEMIRLREAEERAEAALEAFMKTNPEYVRLERTLKAAADERRTRSNGDRQERSRRVNELRILLLANGPTPGLSAQIMAVFTELCSGGEGSRW